MKRIQADLNIIPACKYGMNVHKRWLFVSSYRELRALSGCCQHEPNAHVEIRGKRDASGKYLSKLTSQHMLAYDALFGKLKFRFVIETSQICACGLRNIT